MSGPPASENVAGGASDVSSVSLVGNAPAHMRVNPRWRGAAVCVRPSSRAVHIVSPALLIAGLAVAGHIDGRGPQPHFVFGVGAGYGVVDTTIPCQRVQLTVDGRLVENDCSSGFSGVSLGLGAALMWGRTHRMGLRLDGVMINTSTGGRGGLADALLVYRWHGPVILEGGAGAGYTVAQNVDGDRRGLNVALHGLVGLPISRHVAATLRLAGAIGGMNTFVSGIGLEWSF